jgi:predicted site-specific integrase-resolvase
VQLSAYKGDKMEENSVPKLLSIKRAAQEVGLSRNKLAELIKENLIPVIVIPGYKFTKVSTDDINRFIAEQRTRKI